jgi:hypothetical protein
MRIDPKMVASPTLRRAFSSASIARAVRATSCVRIGCRVIRAF